VSRIYEVVSIDTGGVVQGCMGWCLGMWEVVSKDIGVV
jgi:hypothetical protein